MLSIAFYTEQNATKWLTLERISDLNTFCVNFLVCRARAENAYRVVANRAY